MLVVMDIKSIHKLEKNNVVLDPLSQKEEYQGEMPLGTTQILNAMLVGKSNFEHKIKEGYVKDHFVQHYFVELDNKRRWKVSPF
jgi:hypothetical protein